MLQGPPIEGPYTCVRCNQVFPTYYQTIEKFGERTRVYVCSAACYNRYHRVSQTFQEQTISPRIGEVKVQLTAHVSVNVDRLPTLPDAREDSQPGLGDFLADHKDGTTAIKVHPEKKGCWKKFVDCICKKC